MKKYLYIFIALYISSIIAWAQSGWLGLFWFPFILPILTFVTFPAIVMTVRSVNKFVPEQVAHLKRILTVLLVALFLHHLIVPVLTDSELANGVIIFPSHFINTPPAVLTTLSSLFILVGIVTVIASTIFLIVKLSQYRKANRPVVPPPVQNAS